jgi:acetate kinase
MAVLTINAGSSSIRLAAFDCDPDGPRKIGGGHYMLGDLRPEEILEGFLHEKSITYVEVASHRVVHGGRRLAATCLVEPDVEKEIEGLSSLAPLHNPVALEWIRICRDVLGDEVPQVAVFDTAFFEAMPEVAKTYALPRETCLRHEIRRYGFHGLAHKGMWKRWRKLGTGAENGGRVISLQLGAGCSITAVERGRPMDTSMGFSPLEGLVMATRPGDVDPGLLTYIQQKEGLSPEGLEEMLNRSSGILGVSGMSADMKTLLDSDENDARLAVELYCYRARKYIGAYLAVLGGADAILFGGGVGENAPEVRERILDGMQWCGIVIDKEANRASVGKESRISALKSSVDVWVMTVDEAEMLANEAMELIGNT